jgi:hypothetical protein
MAHAAAGPPQSIPLSDVRGNTASVSRSSASASIDHQENDDYSHVHAGFCGRWPPSRPNGTDDKYTVEYDRQNVCVTGCKLTIAKHSDSACRRRPPVPDMVSSTQDGSVGLCERSPAYYVF